MTVTPDSPAQGAGLRAGDIILAIHGAAVTDETPLAALIAAHEPGDIVTLTIERDGQEQEIEIELGIWPTRRTQTPGGRDSGAGTIRPNAYTVDSRKSLCYLVGNCPHCYILHGRHRLRDQACPLAPQPYELVSERGGERASRYHQEATPRSKSD